MRQPNHRNQTTPHHKIAHLLHKLNPELYPNLFSNYRQLIGKRWRLRRPFLHRPISIPTKRALARMTATGVLGASLLFTTLGSAAHAGTITVDSATLGDGTCDLVEAIDAANADTDNDCTGTDNDNTTNDPDTILFDSGLTTISLSSVNNSENGATGLPTITSTVTISGGTSGVTIERDAGAGADFRIMYINGGHVTLDRVTIRNGQTSATGAAGSGAGIRLNNDATLILNNSTISSNATAGQNARGGGIYAHTNSNVTVSNSTISGNSTAGQSAWGGGISLYRDSNVTVSNSTISGNSTAGRSAWGGGILALFNNEVTVSNSTISGNATTGLESPGGGIFAAAYGNVTVSNSTISGNTTAEVNAKGGGIVVSAATDLAVNNSTISGNTTAEELGHGGGIYTRSSNVTVNNSTISGNTTAGPAALGGGIFATTDSSVTLNNSTLSGNATAGESADGGGIFAFSNSSVTLNNSTLSDNTTAGEDAEGGGIFARDDSNVTVNNSTLSSNATTGEDAEGGGIFARLNSNVTVSNSTLSGNTVSGANADGGGIYTSFSSDVTVSNSLITGNNAQNGDGNEIFMTADTGTIGTFTANGNNLLGDSSETSAQAFVGFTPGANVINGTSDNANIPLNTILDTTLAANGAATGTPLTHALPLGSPAIDVGVNGQIPAGFTNDQRGSGFARIVGDSVDLGAFERSTLPEIEVSVNNISIVDGDTTPTTTDGTDFGNIVVGVPAVQTFIINNTGNDTLSLTAPTISGANASDFAVTTSPATTLAANGSTSFQVTFTPTTPGTRSATISITNSDSNENPYNFNLQGIGMPVLSISDQTIVESSDRMSLTISLSPASSQQVTVEYASADNTAIRGQDYTPISGTLIFAPGETSQQIGIPILEDVLNESEENFVVNLSNATNATIADSQGSGVITDDDGAPTLSIAGVTADESSGTFNFIVTLSQISGRAVSVDYTTADNPTATTINATAGEDYTAQNGTLTIPAGSTQGIIPVPILDNQEAESDELFFVNLGNPVNANLAIAQGIGTILNDDIPSVSVSEPPTATPIPTETTVPTNTPGPSPTPTSTPTPTYTPTPTPAPGSITIHKVADGSGGSILFRFTASQPLAPSLFNLFHGDSYTFENVPPGNYTITESDTSNWVITDIACNDPDNGSTVSGNNANIDMDWDEDITCTFIGAKPTVTPTPTPTATHTAIPTATATDLPTETPTVPPTETPTPLPTETSTPTQTPTSTAIPTETSTPTSTTEPLSNQSDALDDAFDVEQQFPPDVDPTVVTDQDVNNQDIEMGVESEAQVPGDSGEPIPLTLQISVPGGRRPNNTLTGAVVFVRIPEHTRYVAEGSHALTLDQNLASTTWEQPDGSGPCPDGSEAGTLCAFRIGTLNPGDTVELRFNTALVESIPVDATTITFVSELGAANLPEETRYQFNQAVDVAITEPTGLTPDTEPALQNRIFIPVVLNR